MELVSRTENKRKQKNFSMLLKDIFGHGFMQKDIVHNLYIIFQDYMRSANDITK